MDGQILGVQFTPLFLAVLKGGEPSMEDLRLSDPEYHSGLHWIEQNDVASADLPFSVSYEGYFTKN